jgi:hypothetical protein
MAISNSGDDYSRRGRVQLRGTDEKLISPHSARRLCSRVTGSSAGLKPSSGAAAKVITLQRIGPVRSIGARKFGN